MRVFLYLFLLVFLTLGSAVANAQATNPIVIASCSSPPNTLPVGIPSPGYIDASGKRCGSGSDTPYIGLGCTPWQAVTNSLAVSLASVPSGATIAYLTPTVNIVYRDDGGAPTATGPGIIIPANLVFVVPGSLSSIRFIAQTASGYVAVCFENQS